MFLLESNLPFCPVSQTALKSSLIPYTQVIGRGIQGWHPYFLSHLLFISVAMTTVSWDSTYPLCNPFAQKPTIALFSYQVSSPSSDCLSMVFLTLPTAPCSPGRPSLLNSPISSLSLNYGRLSPITVCM